MSADPHRAQCTCHLLLVLLQHGAVVFGTGTSGPMAARLALMRAQRQLHQDADIHIHLRNFAVINSVGAVSLRATLNCEDFASAHTSTAFYDAKSFVGLAWRPTGEPICCGALPLRRRALAAP